MMRLERNYEYIPSYRHMAWLIDDHPAYTSYEKEDSRTRYALEEFSTSMQEALDEHAINKEAKDKMMRIMVDFLLTLSKLEDNTPEYRRISLFLNNFFTRKICHCTCASSGDEEEEDEDDDEEEDDEDEDEEEEDGDEDDEDDDDD
jgi:hypothetical protein